MKPLNQEICLFVLLSLALPMLGCGGNSSQAILPSGELTEEQKAAVKAEDARVDDEESQGKMNKPKSKK